MRRLSSALALGLFLFAPGLALADELPDPEEKKDDEKKDDEKKDDEKKDGEKKEEKSGCSVTDPGNGAIGTIAMGIAILGGLGLARRRRSSAPLVVGLMLAAPATALADKAPSPEPGGEEKKDEAKDGEKNDEAKDGEKNDEAEKKGCAVDTPTDGTIGAMAVGIAILGGFALSRRRRDHV